MQTEAVLLTAPGKLGVETLHTASPGDGDIVVEVSHSGISTGTEKLIWSGKMPAFPGLGYPLVPGYEATGTVVEAGRDSALAPGARVFVPGSTAWAQARGIFGAAARHLVTDARRATPLDPGLGEAGTLLALAATAHHAIAAAPPGLVIGHGTLGRLIARITTALGHPPPVVHETAPARRDAPADYAVLDPEDDTRRDYAVICDASGDAAVLDTAVARLSRGGEVVLAGFYPRRIGLAFAPAFMKEARLRIAAEWTPADMAAVTRLIDMGRLSLDGLITHRAPASDAPAAYERAFAGGDCLKMVLDWRPA